MKPLQHSRNSTDREIDEHISRTSDVKKEHSGQWRLAVRAIIATKLVLIVLIVWILFSTLFAFFDLDSDYRSTTPSGDIDLETSLAAPSVPSVLLSAFDDGAWEFAGVPWRVRMATVPSDEIERELIALSPASESSSVALGNEAQELVAMLRRTGAVESKLGQLTLIQSVTSTGRIVLITRANSEGESLILGRIAWPEENHWKLIEGHPVAEGTRFSSDRTAIPSMKPGVQSMGTRWGRDGTLLGQFFILDESREATYERWKLAGWTVRRSPAEIGRPDSLFLVERGGICYAAHFFRNPDSTTTLFLTRVPDEPSPTRTSEKDSGR